MDYTTLSLAEVVSVLDEIARDVEATFGPLGARQLNWQPDASRWSVAQCFEHLLTANRLVREKADAALDPAQPRTVWQRVPVLPGLLGRWLIRSQSLSGKQKFKAPARARPSASDIPADVILRFLQQHRELTVWMQALDERAAARALMVSPFVRTISYSVRDGCRLIAAHDRRHIEQARRVTQSPGFPS